MASSNGADHHTPFKYYHAEGASGIGGGAKIVNNGVSVWVLLACVLIAAIPGIAALVAQFNMGVSVAAQIGSVSAAAQNAKDIATMSERNAKLAQYQLEQAAARYKLEVPKGLPE